MHHYIAFLRGMNLGNRRIKMDDLRTLFEEMKFGQVSTFIASGNVIFNSKHGDPGKLENLIARHLRQALGYEVDTFVRTRHELAALTVFPAFAKVELENPANTVHAGFLGQALSAEQGRGLLACRTEVDEFCVQGREYFWLCRIKSNESKVWASRAMKEVKLPSSSMRNLTTLHKLVAQYPAAAT